jgi:hypothetical protein
MSSIASRTHTDVAALQIEAAAELFENRRKSIKYLERRAEVDDTHAVCEPADLVGLLLVHTTYKSYPEP